MRRGTRLTRGGSRELKARFVASMSHEARDAASTHRVLPAVKLQLAGRIL